MHATIFLRYKTATTNTHFNFEKGILKAMKKNNKEEEEEDTREKEIEGADVLGIINCFLSFIFFLQINFSLHLL